jgi:hypothetical protein
MGAPTTAEIILMEMVGGISGGGRGKFPINEG